MNRWPFYTDECAREIAALVRSGKPLTGYRANREWGVGPQKWSHAYKFEREIEAKFKVKHAVAVNSGTAALHAALVALDVRGREVITSPFTFSATASAIVLAGGIPRFCDVNPHTFTIGKEEVAKHVTEKTAAILPVHLFGYFPDLSGLLSFGLPVIEDACQAVGAARGNHVSGGVGIAGAYSFNGSKNLPTGEGGCLVTNDSDIAEKARRLCNHGENFGSETVGLNYRMTELHACLARHGLRELESRNQRRRELAEIASVRLPDFDRKCDSECDELGPYHGHLACWGGQHSNELVTPHGPYKEPMFGPWHAYYVVPLLVYKDRAKFISRCAKRGLPIQESYTTPLHHLKAFRKYATRELPVVDELHSKTLCLLTTLTPDRPLSYARRCAKVVRESLE